MSERWYCTAADGVAVLCNDKEDALEVAAESFVLYPQHGPYKAVRLVDAERIEHLERVLMQAREVMQAAIDSGDWTVDGACDPDSCFAAIDEALHTEVSEKR